MNITLTTKKCANCNKRVNIDSANELFVVYDIQENDKKPFCNEWCFKISRFKSNPFYGMQFIREMPNDRYISVLPRTYGKAIVAIGKMKDVFVQNDNFW